MFTKLLELNRIIEGKTPRTKIERLNQGLPEAYRHGIAICFDRATGAFSGLRLVQGSRGVVYMAASGANGFSTTAVQPITNDPRKTLDKIKRCVNVLAETTKEIKEEMKRLAAAFDEVLIAVDVSDKIAEIKPDVENRAYLFVAFINDGKIEPLYAEQEVQAYMNAKAFDDYGTADKKNDSVQNGRVCYVCGEAGRRVYGNFSRLKSYNLDKPGMITGGFGIGQTLKNFPVCDECITAISSAYDYAKRKLSFNFCGESYLLLPCLRTKNDELAETIVNMLEGMGHTTQTSEYTKITGSQNDILEELADVGQGKDSLTLTMVFFKGKNAEWKITAEIPEILPSRISRIHTVKRTVEADEYLKMGDKPFFFTFRTIKDFAGHSGKTSQRKFLGYVDAVFSGGIISERAFLSDVVRAVVTQAKREPKMMPFMVRDALAAWQFLNQLGIFEKGVRTMSDAVGTGGKYGQFVEVHKDFFDAQEKVAAFLTGCYVSKVLYAQGQNLGNSPFYKKLRGMKLDMKRLQALYPEARNKIQQYDAFGLVNEIDPLLASAWVKCGNDWKITDDEATLSFTIGLSLDYNINK
ncbi:MAG: TIGR02556 family CRISPR-associated protein [Proteobacteria bacterium]|nr:TIGR02556 family CRISPR-associated protein [Pseudomonadota bacterium]MBU1714411.1 TIGR02556 family CRISPR-associated protein [Pseudomonadota bacterium]